MPNLFFITYREVVIDLAVPVPEWHLAEPARALPGHRGRVMLRQLR